MVILKELVQQGIVRCSDIDALQKECMTFGNQYSEGAAKNSQPRLCKINQLKGYIRVDC